MQQFNEPILNHRGEPVEGVNVLVRTKAGALAVLYGDDGETPILNPVNTDSTGEAPFRAANGNYTITISGIPGAGITARTVAITLNDPNDASPGTLAQLAVPGGSALMSFISDGVGATSVSIQEILREGAITPQRFMSPAQRMAVYLRTGALDVSDAIVKAQTACLAVTPYKPLMFPSGLYPHSAMLDFSRPGLRVYGAGRRSSELKFTGTGVAVRFTDENPNNGAYAFGGSIEDITIGGNANATTLLMIRNVNHFFASNVNLKEASNTVGVGLQILGGVCGYYQHVICSTNEQLMTSRPQNAYVIDRDPFSMARATDNTLVNFIGEGMCGDGGQLINSDQTNMIGGTLENNDGNNLTITAASRMNIFKGVSFETSRGYADVFDGGYGSQFEDCYTNRLFYVDTSSLFCRIYGGGWHQSITVAGDFATVEDTKYSFAGPGGAVTKTANTSTRNLFNASTGALVFFTKPPAAVTVTASPFTYTNTSGLLENVLVSGGTVTQLVMGRSGAVGNLPVTGGMWMLAPNDTLTFSYTAAPTVTRLPLGSNYL